MASLRRGGYIIDAIGGSIGLADLRIAQGRLHEAMAIYQHGLHLSTEYGLRAPSGMADMFIGMSELHREWNDLDAATRLFAQSDVLGESAGTPQHPHRWRVALARLRASLDDLAGASALLDEAESRFGSGTVPKVRPIPAMRARISIAQGRLDEATAWARDQGISADDPISYLGDLRSAHAGARPSGAGGRGPVPKRLFGPRCDSSSGSEQPRMLVGGPVA